MCKEVCLCYLSASRNTFPFGKINLIVVTSSNFITSSTVCIYYYYFSLLRHRSLLRAIITVITSLSKNSLLFLFCASWKTVLYVKQKVHLIDTLKSLYVNSYYYLLSVCSRQKHVGWWGLASLFVVILVSDKSSNVSNFTKLNSFIDIYLFIARKIFAMGRHIPLLLLIITS